MQPLSNRSSYRDSFGRTSTTGAEGVIPATSPYLNSEVTRASNENWMKQNQQRTASSIAWSSNQAAHSTSTANKISGTGY